MSGFEYRREIDGLRAIAVIPVILFHAGFGLFSGGFVGVDVFFVISGYLITSIILREQAQGSFTLLKFYERRVRRILPALSVVIFACVPLAWLWMMPSQLKDFSQSVVAVSVFASNILFWKESDYFGGTAESMPLLHTWSLAVEEQYYVVFPIFMLALLRFERRNVAAILAGIALASLALSEWGWRFYPAANFYLAPTRAWELLLGALAAFLNAEQALVERFGVVVNQWASLLGLAMIILAIIVFDTNTPFPSTFALLPAVGTVMVIAFAHSSTIVAKLLSRPAVVGIGLISYSAYLWHQPLFAFARIRSLGEVSPLVLGLLGLVALLLAYITWRFIETPFRKKQITSTRIVVTTASITFCCLVSLGLYGYLSGGGIQRFSVQERAMLDMAHHPRPEFYREGKCFLKPDQNSTEYGTECFEALTKGPGPVVVWGDSHAAALSMGIFEALGNSNNAQLTASACPPLLDYTEVSRPHCREINARAINLITGSSSPKVFLAANWINYAAIRDLRPYIRSTVKALKVAGSEVYLVGSLPRWNPSLPEMLVRDMLVNGRSLNELPEYYPSSNLDKLVVVDKMLAQVAVELNIHMVSALNEMCSEAGCRVFVDGIRGRELVAWDYAHLTPAGSLLIGRKIIESNPNRGGMSAGSRSGSRFHSDSPGIVDAVE